MSPRKTLRYPRLICRLAAAVAVLAVAPPSQALTPADLKWDLTYRTALPSSPQADTKFLREWAQAHPDRPIHQKLDAYSGEPIEASLLIEQPDPSSGEPIAQWVVKTRSEATYCPLVPSHKLRCQRLDPGLAEKVLGQVMAFKPLLASNEYEGASKAGGKKDGPTYIGFLSVYFKGVTTQRPIHRIEMDPEALRSMDDLPGEQAMQLSMAMMELTAPQDWKQWEPALLGIRRLAAIQKAVRNGDEGQVLAALEQAAAATAKNKEGSSPSGLLPVAAKSGQFRMVDLLLARGADINGDNGAALRSAVSAGDQKMVEYLLDKGASPDPKLAYLGVPRSESPLGVAVKHHNAALARLLIDRGAKVNGSQTMPVLTAAAAGADLAMVDLLLRAGADPNATDGDSGRTALVELAASPAEGREASLDAVARRLVAAGANINFLSASCETAYKAGSNETVKRQLAALGANPERHAQCLNIAAMARSDTEMRARDATTSELDAYLSSGDYIRLDDFYRKLRYEQQRTPSGLWKLAIFYRALKDSAGANSAQQRVDAWMRARPASVAASIYQAYVYLSNAEKCSCDQPYAQLTGAQREHVAAETGRALKLLAETKAAAIQARDPEWYRAMLAVLPYSPSYTPAKMAEVLQEGARRYPTYHEMYFTAALYARPPWTASAHDIDKVARAAGKYSNAREAGALYARVHWYMDEIEAPGKLFEQGRADWASVRKSFEVIVRDYPTPHNLNAFAYLACKAHDYETARTMMLRSGKQFVWVVWNRMPEQDIARCINTQGS